MKAKLNRRVYNINAVLYRVLANPKRLEILNTLVDQEMSVENLTKILGIRKANVSQHLAVLRHHRLVHTRRNGLNVYYKTADPRIVKPCQILYLLHKNRLIF